MRVIVPLLIVLAVLYFWDQRYNDGKLLDTGLMIGRMIVMGKAMRLLITTDDANAQTNKPFST